MAAVTCLKWRAVPRPDGSYVVLARYLVPPPEGHHEVTATEMELPYWWPATSEADQ